VSAVIGTFASACAATAGASRAPLAGRALGWRARLTYDAAPVLVLSRADVEELLDLDALVDAVAVALRELSAGAASVPPRVAAMVPDEGGLLAVMPAYLPSLGMLATKLVSVFPHNEAVPTHQALLCCFDPATGTPAAVMDGTYITAVRTAAASALATRLLARPDAEVVAVLGTGVQAGTHVEALRRSRSGARFVIAGRDQAKAEAFAASLDLIPTPEVAPSAEAAVRAADIVCATTHAAEPVVYRAWLSPGTHVNSVGYNVSGEGEVARDVLDAALVAIEWRNATLAPPPAGAVELREYNGPVVELGELVAGATGRTRDDQITLYKSVGVAAEDAAAAALVLAAARASGGGTHVEL
jgi:ornithine cyclodeaminase